MKSEIPAGHPTIKYDSSLARQLRGVVTLWLDMQYVVEATKRLGEQLSAPVQDTCLMESLWSGALVAFTRCFSDGTRFGLSPEIYAGVQDGAKYFSYFRAARNKLVSQSIDAAEQVEVGLVLSASGRRIEGTACLSAAHPADSADHVKLLGEMARFALQDLDRRREDLEARIAVEVQHLSADDLKRLEAMPIIPTAGHQPAAPVPRSASPHRRR